MIQFSHSRPDEISQTDICNSYHSHEPFTDDRDHEDHESGEDHLQRLRAGGQSEGQTGDPGQGKDECQDSQNHPGETVQEDPDPLD